MKTKLIKVALLVMSTLTLSLLSYHIHRTWDYDTSLQCPEKMIFLEDLGRFGNKFWEYLAARIISQAQQTQLYVTKDLNKFFNRYFKDSKQAVAVGLHQFREQCNANLWERVFLNVTDISAPLPTWSHIYVLPIGYFATYLEYNFPQQEPNITRISIQARISEQGKRQNAGNHRQSYSLHADWCPRAIDGFLYQSVVLNGGFNQAQKPYFDQAMKYFREKFDNSMFLVVSDDVDWCKQNLIGSDIVFAGNGNENDPGWDLAILKSCDHLILTYGTFTATAGYFSQGEIIIADGFSRKDDLFNSKIKAVHPPKWTWLTITNSTVL